MNQLNRRNREGNDMPLPPYGVSRLLHVVGTHFGRLIFANFLAVVFCIPIFTIPAALTGLHAVVQQYYRKGYGDVWGKFFSEFKTDFFPRLGISAVLAALPAAGLLLGGLLSSAAGYVAGAFLLVLAAIVAGWWFPQMAILKLSAGEALRNAFLMAFVASKENLCLVIMDGISAGLVFLLWPVSILPLALFLPVLLVLLNTNLVNPMLDEKVIREEADGQAPPEEASPETDQEP